MDHNKEKTFFPYYLFEITVVALFTVEAVLILSVLFPSDIGREIDFAAQYSPRPEWYFLFLYQLTKYFPGDGPSWARCCCRDLLSARCSWRPFLDSGKATDLRQRKTAAAAGFLLLALVIGLTVLSLI